MMSNILFHGRKLILYPKLDDPFYYNYVRILSQFENSCQNNPEFIEQFLNKNQKSYKYEMIRKYEKSNSTRRQIEDRIHKYNRHYEPMYGQINPYFGKNLNRVDHHIHQHRRFQNNSNFDSYSRHSNSDFFRYEPPPRSISMPENCFIPGPSNQHPQFQMDHMEPYPPCHPPFFNRPPMSNNYYENDYQDNYRNQRHFSDSLPSSRYHPYSRHR